MEHVTTGIRALLRPLYALPFAAMIAIAGCGEPGHPGPTEERGAPPADETWDTQGGTRERAEEPRDTREEPRQWDDQPRDTPEEPRDEPQQWDDEPRDTRDDTVTEPRD